MIEAVNSSTISEPIIAGNTCAVAAVLKLNLKGVDRMPMEELAVYEVRDGKLIREQLFYQP